MKNKENEIELISGQKKTHTHTTVGRRWHHARNSNENENKATHESRNSDWWASLRPICISARRLSIGYAQGPLRFQNESDSVQILSARDRHFVLFLFLSFHFVRFFFAFLLFFLTSTHTVSLSASPSNRCSFFFNRPGLT